MTQPTDRLDRIEALLARAAESNAASAERLDRSEANLDRIEKITESNARAIEAWEARITEGDQRGQTQLEASIADTVAMIADLGRQQGDTDERFQVFLAEASADRAEWRAAREANSTEHRAFTQNIQVLLAEIARLWQRVAG